MLYKASLCVIIQIMKKSNETVGVLCGIFSHVLFALSFLFTKEAVNVYSALAVLSWRFIFAFAALGICALTGIIKVDLKGKSIKPLLFIALFQPVLYFIGETIGIKLTTASESGTLTTMLPIVTIVLCSLIIKEKPTRPQVAGIVISILGVLMIVLAKGLDASLNVLGYAMLVLAMVSDGLCVTFQRKAKEYSSGEKTLVMAGVGAVVFTGMACVEQGMNGTMAEFITLPFRDTDFLTAVLYLAVGCQTLAFLMANHAILDIGPARCTSFAGITTVVSVLAGVIFLKESFSLMQGIGTALVLAGVYTANINIAKLAPHRRERGKQRPETENAGTGEKA